MTFEERLRTSMRGHEHQAPTTVHWSAPAAATPPPRPRRFALAGVLLVGVLLATGVVAVLWPRPARQDPAGPLSCPANYTPQMYGVPAPPSAPTVPGAADRLVPSATPDSALVCGYLSSDPQTTGPVGLSREVTLRGDLADVASTLTLQPAALPTPAGCRSYLASTDADGYLVGLTYADGTVWVVAPANHCVGSGNGAFTSRSNVSSEVAAWIADGSATPTTPPTAMPSDMGCPASAPGRRGDESELVPPGATGVSICVGVRNDPDVRTVSLGADDTARLAAALDALPTRPTTNGCQQNSLQTPFYELAFRYGTGPDAGVSVWAGCDPQVRGGALDSGDASGILPLLVELTR